MINCFAVLLLLLLLSVGISLTINSSSTSSSLLSFIYAQTETNSTNLNNSSDSSEIIKYIVQKTELSKPASPTVTPHGKLPHQIVFGLPLRDDGRIWTGTVTFTASKPIELEVLHFYNTTVIPDKSHGEPYHATLPGNKTVAISTMSMFSETPVLFTDTPISTGSLTFTGSALVFHKTSGEPFTVTYTIDAEAKHLSNN